MPPTDNHASGAAPYHDDYHDADVTPHPEQGPSVSSEFDPDVFARSTRRARVEDDEGDDESRAFNRQRRHAPAHDDDDHQYMPIPEDHGIPPSASEAPASPAPSQDGPAPSPPYSRMMWTFEFMPIHSRLNAQAPEGIQSQGWQDSGHRHAHDPAWNVFINVPITGGGPAPPSGAAAANQGSYSPIISLTPYFYLLLTDQPGNTGFAFPPFPPFPFPFGIDTLEERDDPQRAQRLLKGLEDIPVGLVKRMERAGGPGTDCGQVPTCAICWESLLEPQGGGFEGNAELARAEAAREDDASQQACESSMEADAPSSAPVGGSDFSVASSSRSSEAQATSTPGETQHPKIVGFPCAHVFHATCLLPWFSKPGRTTCPSCRFDIDPDSLTYQPHPLRSRPGSHPPAGSDPQPTGMQGDAATHPHIVLGPLPPRFHAAVPPAPPAVPSTDVQNTPAQPDGGQHTHENPPERTQNLSGLQQTPPFISFDISMFIPVVPGRMGGLPPPATSNVPPAGAQGPTPPLTQTDNHGFPFHNPFLQEAVRNTFGRLFSRSVSGGVTTGNSATPSNNGQPRPDHWITFSTGPLPTGIQPIPPMNMNIPQGAPRHQTHPRRPVEKRQWAPPPAPGPTLRQVVERNERQLGLRCSDVSCGLGPSDDDPVSSVHVSSLRQIAIRPLKSGLSGEETVCVHTFHPACLVSAERVAGWGQEVKTGEPAGGDENVEVSCPACRAHGVISRAEWEEGARALA